MSCYKVVASRTQNRTFIPPMFLALYPYKMKSRSFKDGSDLLKIVKPNKCRMRSYKNGSGILKMENQIKIGEDQVLM